MPITCMVLALCSGPELGKRLGECPVSLVLSRCSPKVLPIQLVDEVTSEFPNVGSGWEGTGRKRPLGRGVFAVIPQVKVAGGSR